MTVPSPREYETSQSGNATCLSSRRVCSEWHTVNCSTQDQACGVHVQKVGPSANLHSRMDDLEAPEFKMVIKIYQSFRPIWLLHDFSCADNGWSSWRRFCRIWIGWWQVANSNDYGQIAGELSTAYSLEAETAAIDVRIGRHPRIVFSCEQSGRFDGVRIRTGLVLANQYPGLAVYSSGPAGPRYQLALTTKSRKPGLLTLREMAPICFRTKESSLTFWVTNDL